MWEIGQCVLRAQLTDDTKETDTAESSQGVGPEASSACRLR